ncbi:MAG: metallophosphatase domain-containing protein [Bacteriovoracia bacterium]
MRVVFISDTHNQLKKVEVPDGDIVIHAGDATYNGTVDEVKEFAESFNALPHKQKIFVPGNHDWLFETNLNLAKEIMGDKVRVLIDELITVADKKIYGSPWSPRFKDFAFNLDRGELLEKNWNKIPKKLDILITHTPPYGVLDSTFRGEKVGCEGLLKKLPEVMPVVHVFGHIHEGYGVLKRDNVSYVNASICNRAYKPFNKPIVLDV